MTWKFLRISIILVTIFVLILLFFRGCTYWFWNEWDSDRTLNVFQENRRSFDSLVAWAGDKKSKSCVKQYNVEHCLPQQLHEITKDYLSVSYTPFIVETSPVNFHYVLVYTKNPEEVKKSEVYRDEGKILQKVDQNWTLVRRGWM